MYLRVLHRNTFTYAGKAHDSFNEIRLRPVSDSLQRCVEFKLHVVPGTNAREYDDFCGNTVHYFEVADNHSKLVIEATSIVETVPTADRPPIPRVGVSELEESIEREMLAEFYTACWARQYLDTGRVDGFILMTATRKQSHIRALLEIDAPFIVWGVPPSDAPYCSVTGDNLNV